jgi:hypothetical protein
MARRRKTKSSCWSLLDHNNWLTEDSDLDSDVERLVPTLPKLEQPNLGQTEPEPARAERFHFLSRKSGAWYCNDVCQIVVSGDVS